MARTRDYAYIAMHALNEERKKKKDGLFHIAMIYLGTYVGRMQLVKKQIKRMGCPTGGRERRLTA